MEIRSNVLNRKITNELITATLKDIAENLANSLGPFGSTSILEDPIANHIISKDGYTILGKFKYNNEVSQTVFEIIKKISRSLVREVGDGSTSSIIIASKLYEEIENYLNIINISPKIIIKVLKTLEDVLERRIKDKAIPITSDNFQKIEDIATVSNNNDRELGKLIANLYKEVGVDGFITLENSKTEKDYYEIKDGYEIQRGFIDSVFINAKNKVDFEAEKPLIFICNDTLNEDDLEYLQAVVGNVTMSLKRPLVIIAKDYDSEVVNFLKINKIQNRELNIVAIDYSLANLSNRESLEDFATYVDAKIYDKYGLNVPTTFDISMMGRCEKVIVSEKSSRFIEGSGKKADVEGRIEYLNEQLEALKLKDEKEDMSFEIFKLQKRISALSSTIATFYVGGNSEIEKENRKFLLEDSIYACQSTLRNGYIIGGNLIIPLILLHNEVAVIKEVEERLIADKLEEGLVSDIVRLVKESFEIAFQTVLKNYKNDKQYISDVLNNCLEEEKIFNLTTLEYETIDETTVINSASTDIEIMKATFSIIGLLATSNQFVSRSLIRDEFYV